MKGYQKPEIKHVEFAAEEITTSVAGSVPGSTDIVIPGEPGGIQ